MLIDIDKELKRIVEITAGVVVFAVIWFMFNSLSEAKAPEPLYMVSEPIPFEQTIAHDIDKACYMQLKTFEEVVEPEPEYRIDVTTDDVEIMARIVMNEASVLGHEGRRAVAEVIVNRVLAQEFPGTVAEVCYQKNAFSHKENGDVTEDCYKAVKEALTEAKWSEDMVYFRTDYYHSYGTPYIIIGNTYFSTK